MEYDDSDDISIQKINRLIKDRQYGIHNLSLAARYFNMPLELGIFIGCKQFGNIEQRRKKYLILENQTYQSRQFNSNLSGQDVKAYENNVQTLMRSVRERLSNKSQKRLPFSPRLFEKYETFKAILPELCQSENCPRLR
ncbi:hypothetical protein [Dyadobacter fanqingshengii]|uniref:Uncharacterized protein n=1 Tax=Dyadobacter fanqingshengii TaxID=2906443 RepID=A0A9X1P9E9_9BACT|nr:hypothetical protein [Dyadobacter fanqingshengii]MCF0039733.1 hypothetical protein [Dyadobacter fanqingshengii]USJ38504.1 hypothetical protein NFI81_12130 [Dyadobacter fanqingshengii]